MLVRSNEQQHFAIQRLSAIQALVKNGPHKSALFAAFSRRYLHCDIIPATYNYLFCKNLLYTAAAALYTAAAAVYIAAAALRRMHIAADAHCGTCIAAAALYTAAAAACRCSQKIGANRALLCDPVKKGFCFKVILNWHNRF